jgi:hypothetical protein
MLNIPLTHVQKQRHLPHCMQYAKEIDLVADLMGILGGEATGWGRVDTLTEFIFANGVTDVVAVTPKDEVIAFEAKLSRWRDAMYQAYRARTWAHYAYVVLPEPAAFRALTHVEEFLKLSVGICYLRDGQLVIAALAPRRESLQPGLTARLISTARGDQREQPVRTRRSRG